MFYIIFKEPALHTYSNKEINVFFFQGFIIGFTSDFIPRLVYQYHYSPDNSLSGYTNFTLSAFDPKDFGTGNLSSSAVCYYYDFRKPPGDPEEQYTLKEAYWHVLAARLAFVVVFQNVVSLTVMIIK